MHNYFLPFPVFKENTKIPISKSELFSHNFIALTPFLYISGETSGIITLFLQECGDFELTFIMEYGRFNYIEFIKLSDSPVKIPIFRAGQFFVKTSDFKKPVSSYKSHTINACGIIKRAL